MGIEGVCSRNWAMLGSMTRLTAAALLLSVTGIAAGQNSNGQSDGRLRVLWDAMHGTELSPRDSVSTSKRLSVRDRAALRKAIEAELRADPADLDKPSDKGMASAAGATRIRLVDLNGDGVAEVIAQSMGWETCGAVGNCETWVFKKTAAGYVSILDAGSQSFAVDKTRTDGYLDLTLALHDSATRKELRLYRFEGGRYRRVGCYEADWMPVIDGPVLKRPKITGCK